MIGVISQNTIEIWNTSNGNFIDVVYCPEIKNVGINQAIFWSKSIEGSSYQLYQIESIF